MTHPLSGRKQTPEHIAKRLISTRLAGAYTWTAERRRKNGERKSRELKGRPFSGHRFDSTGVKQSPEQLEKLSAVRKGRCPSAETRAKMSATASRLLRLRGRVEFLDRKGRLVKFKSRWELHFAQWMEGHEIAWDYEPDTLLLSDGRRYTPDFRLGNIYVEIKHPKRLTRLDKVCLAQFDGHDVRLVLSISDLEQILAAPARSM